MSFWAAAVGGFFGGAAGEVAHAPTPQVETAEATDYVAAEAIRQEPDAWVAPPWTEIMVPHPSVDPPPLPPPTPAGPPGWA